MKFGIGQAVPRKEDPRLVTGGGCFSADVSIDGQLHLKVLRSPFAHGRITLLDTSAAAALAGVRLILTSADLSTLKGLPCRAVLKDAEGHPAFIPHRPVLAEDKVCYVGQPVAAVIADSVEAAQLAVEAIEFDVTDLPANTALHTALHVDTPVVHEQQDSNLCVHYEVGDADAVDTALAGATHQVSVDLVNNRVAPSPLEPRACVGLFDTTEQQYVLYNPSQGPVAQQGVLATVFGVDTAAMRVISLDTGGGFGIRGEVQPEACLCLFAARQLACAVKYAGDRAEMFLTDPHGRDNLTTVTGGFAADGRLVALRVETLANIGAYCTAVGPFVPTMAGGRIVGTVYRIPHVHHSVKPVFTNTQPVAAYRGAGRPEACYVMERLMEAAARQLDMDSISLRERNFISSDEMPYILPSGVALTSGEFRQTLRLGLEKSDWEGFATRQRDARARGVMRGQGIGYYIESSGGGPEEEAHITLQADGTVDVVVGTFSHGQGHRTTYSQILSERLGVDFEAINIIQGDTQSVKFGGGTGGSRSSQMGGIAVRQAADAVLEDAQDVAAELMQVARDTVAFAAGSFTTSANDSAVSLQQVASAAQTPEFGARTLARTHRYDRGGGFTFPNGAHIAEVEVDPQTGVVELVKYTAVDDCGRVINPLLASGQVHGGVVQGVGQTLYENVVYDPDGQLLTGSLMDYTMPRATHVPDIAVHFNEVLDPHNELGVKGIGEGGACGAPPAVVNAVLHALGPLGVEHVDMPLTAENIWRALQAAH